MDTKEGIEQNNKLQAAIKTWSVDKDDKALEEALNVYKVYLDKLTVQINKERELLKQRAKWQWLEYFLWGFIGSLIYSILNYLL